MGPAAKSGYSSASSQLALLEGLSTAKMAWPISGCPEYAIRRGIGLAQGGIGLPPSSRLRARGGAGVDCVEQVAKLVRQVRLDLEGVVQQRPGVDQGHVAGRFAGEL